MYQGVVNVIQHLKTLNSLQDWKAEDLIAAAELVVKELKENRESLSTQIYRFLTAVRKLDLKMRGSTAEELSIRREALLLRPKFAYAVSRKPALRPLYLVTEAMMEKLQREGKEWRRDFQELINFMEAVVAYYDYK